MTPSPTPGAGDGLRVADVAAWIIRTYVPIGVVAVLGWAAVHWHLVLGQGTSATVAAYTVLGALAVYTGAARWLERRGGDSTAARVARWVGRWMLGGIIRQPVYARPDERVRVLTADGSLRRPG
jgi:hypothetical protein